MLKFDSSMLNRTGGEPLYRQIADVLAAAFHHLEKKKTVLPPTLELARQFGVSHKTIENAMRLLSERNQISRVRRRGSTPITEETLEADAKGRSIGFVCPISGYDFWQPMLKAMHQEAAENHYSLDIYLYRWNDRNDERRALSKASGACSGVILYPNSCGSDRELIRKFNRMRPPLLLYLLYFDDIDAGVVTSNNLPAAYELTRQLISGGAKQIAFIHENLHLITPRLRLEGYRRALEENGLSNGEILDSSSMSTAMADAVRQHSDALVCGSLRIAMKFAGVIPPEKIAFFASPWQETQAPPGSLVACNQPEELGKCAIREIIEKIRRPLSPNRKIQINLRIIRTSQCTCGRSSGRNNAAFQRLNNKTKERKQI